MPSNLSVLLDAVIIIEAHKLGVWDDVLAHATLAIPVSVRNEAKYYRDPTTRAQIAIDLAPAIHAGKLIEVSASPEHVGTVRGAFTKKFLRRLHPGETEALALVLAGRLPDYRVCTADGPAIQALALLGLPGVGLAFEELLDLVGATAPLRYFFGRQYFLEQIALATQEARRREALRNP